MFFDSSSPISTTDRRPAATSRAQSLQSLSVYPYFLIFANIGATDHVSFDGIGLPGFEFIRDYMEGNNARAPHTNMDTYDHVLEEDLKQSVAVAARPYIYNLAMFNEKLPRKPLPSH